MLAGCDVADREGEFEAVVVVDDTLPEAAAPADREPGYSTGLLRALQSLRRVSS